MLALLLVSMLPALATSILAPPGAGCSELSIISARGSNEPQGPNGTNIGEGIIGSLAQLIQDSSSHTITRANVKYPATLTQYAQSSASGAAALKQQLASAVSSCPDQEFILLGYSQGAHIIGDALAGGAGGVLGPKTPPIQESIRNKVAAVVLMGDPRNTEGQNEFKIGTSTRDGLFPRASDQSLEVLGERVVAFCDAEDIVCDSGDSRQVHLGYTRRYNNVALDFVIARIGG